MSAKACWLCGNFHDIWDSGLCFDCSTWAENYAEGDETENELRRMYSEYTANELPRMIADLLDLLGEPSSSFLEDQAPHKIQKHETTHTNLSLKTLRDDPHERVIWNQERPIAYLNRADASADEFIDLENLIIASPNLVNALKAISTIVLGSKSQMENQIAFARRTAKVAIAKVKNQ